MFDHGSVVAQKVRVLGIEETSLLEGHLQDLVIRSRSQASRLDGEYVHPTAAQALDDRIGDLFIAYEY